MADPYVEQAIEDEARLLSGQGLQFSKGRDASRRQPSYQNYMNNSIALQLYNANIEYSKLPSTIAQNQQMAQAAKGGGFFSSLLPIVAIVLPFVAPGLGAAIGAELLGTSGAIASGAAAAGAAESIVGSAVISGGMTAIQGGSPEQILQSAITSGAATGFGGIAGQEAAAQLPAGTDPSLVRAVAGATSGAVGSAIRGGDVERGALVGGISPVISDVITSGEDVTRPAGQPITTGMEPEQVDPFVDIAPPAAAAEEPVITPAPDQGEVPTPPPVQIPEGPITDQEVLQQIQTPEAPVEPTQELPPAVQTLPEVEVTAEPETPTRDQQILDLTGLAPQQPVQTMPEVEVTAEPEQVDPFVDIAPPTEDVTPIAEISEGTPAPEDDFEPYPEKKSDYTREISSILNTLLRDSGGGGIGGRTYDLGGGGGPGSQALAQALRVDSGAPIFGGEKKGKRRNVWNIESLRTKDETGA